MKLDLGRGRNRDRHLRAPFSPSRLACAGLVASTLASAAWSTDFDCFDYAQTLHWLSNVPIHFPTTVAVRGDVAFVGADSSLFGIDLTDLSEPRILCELDLKTPIGEPEWRDDLLYLPVDGAGLAIFDVTLPAAPVLASWIDTPGAAFDVALRGDYAFVADFSTGVQVIDVSDPSAPAFVTTLATPGFAYDVMTLGSLLLVGHGRGFLVADVTDPLAPAVLGNLPTTDRVVGVDAAGTLAAAAAESSGLLLIDIANPGAPHLLGQMATPDEAFEVAVHGDAAFVAVPWYGLEVIDLADPAHPALAFTVGGTHKPAMSVVAGDRLVVADFSFEVQVFHLGDDWLPPPLGATPTQQSTTTLAVAGDHAYLPTSSSDRGWLEIYDISSPTAPAFLAAADALPYARTIAIADGTAFVGSFDGVQVFDVSDPASPVSRSTLPVPGGAIAVALGPPGMLFALSYGEYHSTFYTVNVADPAAPEILGSLLLPWPGTGITYGLLRAYVYGYWGLQIVDPSRPEAPVQVGAVDLQSTDFELALPDAGARREPLAYALDFGEISIADMSDPDAPRVVGSVLAPAATDIVRQGRYLYANGYGDGLAVYDLAIPDRPLLIGGTAADLNGGAIAAHPGTGHVVVAGAHRLRVLARQCETPGAVTLTVNARGRPGGVEISWFPSGGSDLVAIRILRSRSPDVDYVFLTPEWLPAGEANTFVDRSAAPGVLYFYSLEALDRAGATTTFGPVSAAAGVPVLELAMPRPNPFRGSDRIEIGFVLPERTRVHLDVIDVTGRRVKGLVAGVLEAGPHAVGWDGTNDRHRPLASGHYILHLKAGSRAATRHLVCVR